MTVISGLGPAQRCHFRWAAGSPQSRSAGMRFRTVGTFRGSTPAFRRARVRVSIALASVVVLAVVAGLGIARTTADAGVSNVVGNGFTVTPGDLAFILKQIKIAEHHAATATPANPCGTLVGRGPDQIPDALTSYGLRTVDGSCNNLLPGREKFAAADVPFPRLAGSPVFKQAEGAPAGFFGAGSPAIPSSSYAQKKGFVFDTQPRVISNLISDQTSTNPAAVAAALFPVRTQGNPASATPCTTEPTGTTPGVPAGCTPAHKTLFIPNVTTDVGLSPPFNSWFTFFGQFFDHGVDHTVKSGGTVFGPLHDDDPLVTLGPDGILNTGDEVPVGKRFMVLTRAQNQPGPDGILGDDLATSARRRVVRRHPEREQRRYAVGRSEPDVHVALLAPGLRARVRHELARQARRDRRSARRRRCRG